MDCVSCDNSSRADEENQEEGDEMFIDDVLRNMGPYGRFQIILAISMFLAILSTGYHFSLIYFTANDPPWECIHNNSSHFCSINGNVSIDSSSNMFQERCKLEKNEWAYETPKQYSLITEFDLVCENSSTGALASSAVYMGGIIGSIVSGVMSDRYGRKPIIVLSLFLTASCSIGCTFVTTIWQFIGINIVNGAAIVGCYFSVMVYLSEFTSPNYRTLFCNIGLFGLVTSFMLLDLTAYFIRSWRTLERCMSISTITSLVIISLFLPESPRWLLVNGNKVKATNVFEKVRKFNGNQGCTIKLKYEQMKNEKKHTYLDLFRVSKVAVLTLCLGILWIVMPTVEYTIALESSNIGGNMYQAFAITTSANIPSAVVSTYVCNRFGRKKAVLGGLFISGIIVGIVGVIPRDMSHHYIVSITLMAFSRFILVTGFYSIYTWTFELYPTVLRSQGMAVCAVFDRVGMFVVPFIVKLLHNVNQVLPFILICGLALIGSAIGIKLPETNKLPTRERYEDFFEGRTTRTSFSNGIDNCVGQDTEEKV